MAKRIQKKAQTVDAYFLPETFVVEFPLNEFPSLEETFESDKHRALFYLGFSEKEKWFSPVFEYLHSISEMLIHNISRQPDIEFMRENIKVDISEEELINLKDNVPFAVGMEYVDEKWVLNLWKKLLDVFADEIKKYEGTVSEYITEHNSKINVAGRVFFHLVENHDENHPFAFMATYSTKPVKSKRAVHTPLKNALTEFEGDENKLLSLISTVIKASHKSDFISQLIESGELFSPIKLTKEEAYTFLKETKIYEEAGIMCRVPDWWRKKRNALRLSVLIGDKKPSMVGLDAILNFSPEIYVGEDGITEKQLRKFLDMAEGLILYKGKWVEINKKKIEAALNAFDKIKNIEQEGIMSLSDAMRMELNIENVVDLQEEGIDVSISNGKWMKEMRNDITNMTRMEKPKLSSSFKASLRPYQEAGYYWIMQMARYGFGACLADDMGLGKTVQVIAFLEKCRTEDINKSSPNAKKALLVLPASLIGNWENEIGKFAPKMPYQVLHKSGSNGIDIEDGKFLYITTYGMARRLEALKTIEWDYMVLDEAQAIKNPSTAQTKSVKSIRAKMKIAMTGTPIENRLSDLWSLFDFLNKGLLGTTKEFSDFAKNLSENTAGYSKLRKMIQPFILRRLKTDKKIISDLPDKLEINAYTLLSKKQVALYKRLLDDIKEKLEQTEGIERKGVVLSSIMKFKQICNHPDQYIGREDYKETDSGKFEKLREICEIICEKRERVLVFTQFREMTEPISEFLKEIFNREGIVLHGGTPVKKRKELVKLFNGEKYVPFMVLSLKAGGVGLNLAAANHVIHFDRWWNPAVENQATDRAFRIGQTKNVMVHKFVTKGTIEEKIDSIIHDKQKLASDILESTGEKWITEYSNKELIEMFKLSGDVK